MQQTVFAPVNSTFRKEDLALVLSKAISRYKMPGVAAKDLLVSFILGSALGGLGGAIVGYMAVNLG